MVVPTGGIICSKSFGELTCDGVLLHFLSVDNPVLERQLTCILSHTMRYIHTSRVDSSPIVPCVESSIII